MIDNEMRAMASMAQELEWLDPAARARMLRYLASRYMPEPLVLMHDDDSDQEECTPWPTELAGTDAE